jgi:hypothetical protein
MMALEACAAHQQEFERAGQSVRPGGQNEQGDEARVAAGAGRAHEVVLRESPWHAWWHQWSQSWWSQWSEGEWRSDEAAPARSWSQETVAAGPTVPKTPPTAPQAKAAGASFLSAKKAAKDVLAQVTEETTEAEVPNTPGATGSVVPPPSAKAGLAPKPVKRPRTQLIYVYSMGCRNIPGLRMHYHATSKF